MWGTNPQTHITQKTQTPHPRTQGCPLACTPRLRERAGPPCLPAGWPSVTGWSLQKGSSWAGCRPGAAAGPPSCGSTVERAKTRQPQGSAALGTELRLCHNQTGFCSHPWKEWAHTYTTPQQPQEGQAGRPELLQAVMEILFNKAGGDSCS